MNIMKHRGPHANWIEAKLCVFSSLIERMYVGHYTNLIPGGGVHYLQFRKKSDSLFAQKPTYVGLIWLTIPYFQITNMFCSDQRRETNNIHKGSRVTGCSTQSATGELLHLGDKRDSSPN